ncbi:MAG TPA: PEGA domain-containing protein [Kofleriaceae bacterium]|nr:PEGA domain-containing protein [Kofleriaceae bacterium]
MLAGVGVAAAQPAGGGGGAGGSGAPAAAPGDAALKIAQSAFDEGQVAFLSGDFDKAADNFKKAYDARPFPQFLYNIAASYHRKGKAKSDPDAYDKAVTYYKRYLDEDKNAQDRDKVEKAISVLEGEAKRLRATPTPGGGSGSSAPPAAPSKEVEQLGEAGIRGLMVIESSPQGATIYLDGKDKGPFGTTPWSGTVQGEHTISVEKRGYKIAEKRIAADPSKLTVLSFVIAEEDYLGWLEIKSNVPGADIFLDDKAVGAIGKTPYSGNFKPGKHTVWVSADGYDEYQQQIEVIAGEAAEVNAALKGSPVGYLNLRGPGIEDSKIYVDDQILCERGPCRKPVKEGEHTIVIRRPGYKPYIRRMEIQAKTETSIKVDLSPEPGRADAIVTYVISAGFLGGGIYLGMQSSKLHDDIQKQIDSGMPPPDQNDPRFQRGKIYAIAADAAFGLAAITALTAVYYTFREKGAPSAATIDVRAVALTPEIGPGYAGLGLEVHW